MKLRRPAQFNERLRTVIHGRRHVGLSPQQAMILGLLAHRMDGVLPHEELARAVNPDAHLLSVRKLVAVRISQIRARLRTARIHLSIRAVHSRGYRLRTEVEVT